MTHGIGALLYNSWVMECIYPCIVHRSWVYILLYNMSSDTIFTPIFRPFSTQLHSLSLPPIFSHMTFPSYIYPFMPWSRSRTDNKNTINWLLPVTNKSIYLATNIPKQSCSPPTRSCAGTLSAVLACSHNSKFWTSWTRSASRSASTARSPLLIARFLVSTAARTPWPTASIQQTVSSDLARDVSDPARIGKVITPATRFTVTSFYRVFVRMEQLLEETLGWNAALASTHREGNETRDHRSRNRERGNVLKQREIVNLHILLRLFQEHLNMGLQLLGTKDCVVFRIGIHRSRWMAQNC